jgi:hypothetical protein
MSARIRKVTRKEIDQALEKVEEQNIDDANLLRSYIASLESQLRVYQLEADLSADDEIGWAGALE